MLGRVAWRGVTPPHAVTLDRSHPRARGLIGFWLLNGNGLQAVNLVRPNQKGDITAPGWVPTPFGTALSLDGSTTLVDVGTVPDQKPTTVPYSVAMAGFFRNVSTTNKGIFVTNGGAGQGVYRGIMFYISPGSGVTLLQGNGGGNASSNRRNKTGGTTIAINTPYVLSASSRSLSANDMSLYVNGKDDGGSYSGTGATISDSSSNPAQIGGLALNVVAPDAAFAWVAFWNRNLTDVEHAELYRDPYGLFEGSPRTTFFFGISRVEMSYIAAATTVYSLTTTSAGESDIGYISAATSVYALTLVQQEELGYIAAAGSVYSLSAREVIKPGFIAATGSVYALALQGRIPLPYIASQTVVVPPTLRRNVSNTVAPMISGTPQQGLVLEAWTGTWTGPPGDFAYQWTRCNAGGTACVDIAGATSQTYIVTASDIGSTLRVRVTAAGVSATSAATAVVTAGYSVPTGSTGLPPPTPDLSQWQFVLCDRATGAELADISFVSAGKYLKRRLSRPSEAGCSVRADSALARTRWTDGYPFLDVGRRCLKVRYRRDPSMAWELWFHGVIWFLEDAGTANRTDTAFHAFDPLMMSRFRMARDDTGNYSYPTFNNGGAITGPDWLRQLIRNSISNSGAAFDMEGEMGLDVETGDFDMNGVDVSNQISDWPKTIADIQAYITNGPCDVWVDPVDTSAGYAAGVQGRLNAVTRAGSSSIVHYDYGVGDHSIAAIRRSIDMDSLANKLRYLLGPWKRVGHWRGSVESTNAEFQVGGGFDPPGGGDLTDLGVLIDQSRDDFLVFQDVRIYEHGADDDDPSDDDNNYRDLFMRLWQTEQAFRVQPRELLFITPTISAPFRVETLRLGDEITINVGEQLRLSFSAQQRVFGWNVTISEENVTRTEEIVTSADGDT